jgi:hypothetical protein
MRSSRPIAILALLAGTAHAQDAFEIQVYDADTAHAGEAGIELHVNYHRIDGAPNQMHTTFEPHYGLREWLELGGYLQASTATGEAPDFAGGKLRLKARLPHRYWHEWIGFAINGELSAIPSQFEPGVYGSEVRPIAELRAGILYAAINPILSTDLAGSLAGHPQFEPCAKLELLVTERIGLGLEGYGGFGPIDDLGSESVERGFATFDYKGSTFDINFGLGVTHGSADHPVFKLIFGMHP